MKAETVETESGRIIVSRVSPLGKKCVCLEIHKKEPGGGTVRFAVSFDVLTRAEAQQVAAALEIISGITERKP